MILAIAAGYYRWGSWRRSSLIPDATEVEEQTLATSEPIGRLQPTG